MTADEQVIQGILQQLETAWNANDSYKVSRHLLWKMPTSSTLLEGSWTGRLA